MVFFRVTQNINIKVTDGTIVKYSKLKKPSELVSENIYCATYDELNCVKKVLSDVDNTYDLKVVNENKITSKKEFPIELGISNKNEYSILTRHRYEISKKSPFVFQNDPKSLYHFALNDKPTFLYKQLTSKKNDIKLVIIGSIGKKIGEIVNGLSAVRILYEYLQKKYKSVKIDIYLPASNNAYYTRDKDIIKNEYYINSVNPLCINVKQLCEYDYYIDNSLVQNSSYYSRMPFVDAYLHKFGIDYKKIPNIKKHNHLDISSYKPSEALVQKIKDLKAKGELLLYHPFSSEISRSIPEDVSMKLLKKLVKKSENRIIISVLDLKKFEDEHYENLSKYSKSYYDFVYIISNMDKIITVDTSTYHISDAFFIPTVVLFSGVKPEYRSKYYQMTESIEIVDKTKNFSQFVFDHEDLSLYRFDGWQNLKINKVMKVLDKIG